MINKKILWLDTETTGLNPNKHGVIQVAAIFEHGNTMSIFNALNNCSDCKIDDEALEITGHRKKDIKKYPKDTFDKLIKFLDYFLNKYDKKDKATLIGYNVKFDLEMLHGWAKREGFDYLGSYLDWRVVDVLVLARNEWLLGRMPAEPKDFKLGSICEVYGIEVPNHDALDDIKATRELYYRMIKND